MADFPVHTELILKKILVKRLKKAEAAKQLGVSRKTIYQWLKKFTQDNSTVLETSERLVNKDQKIPAKRNKKEDFIKNIIGIVAVNPGFGPQRISQELKKEDKNLSVRSVWLILKKLNLANKRERENFSQNFQTIQNHQIQYNKADHLRLTKEARKRLIEAVLIYGHKVNEVTAEFGISRKTFAKWKKRYLIAKKNDQYILPAMSDQNVRASNHPRGTSERIIQAVLALASQNPALSTHKIAGQLGFISNHGVQNILKRANLSTYQLRLSYAQTLRQQSQLPEQEFALPTNVSTWGELTPNIAALPPPSPSYLFYAKKGLVSLIFLLFLASFLILCIRFFSSYSFAQALGLVFASISLLTGMLFFLYSLKYYITLAIVLSFSQQSVSEPGLREEKRGRKNFWNWLLGLSGNGNNKIGQGGPVGLEPNLEHVSLRRHPLVSIQIPFYNEKNVAERAIAAACNLDWPAYEVIIADDSTDQTSEIIRKYQEKFGKPEVLEGNSWTLTTVKVREGLILKHLHRTNRSGFKGAALNLALKHTDPRVEFICIFDADFVPYPDTIALFLKYFKVQNNLSEDYSKSNVAAVQGYQWHVLNKSENWLTRGIRSEYAGSYVIERAGTELYGGLKMISGSVYMIRRTPLEEVGWGRSITEDFELTLKLYEKGYKVVYTPYIQAPAECVSTLKRLIRQRMRWAEGHSFNIKRMFFRLFLNSKLNIAEKFELLYLSPYYLQAFFFLIGTMSWMVSEAVFQVRLPFWTSLWGWSLVLTNMLSLPLVNIVGLFLEESEEKDYLGVGSFLILCYLVVPFQAYAALKGFLESEEGTWFRTPKTGKITDVFTRGRFMRLISGIFSGAKSSASVFTLGSSELSPYLALSTANNRFDQFQVPRRRLHWLARSLISLLLIFSVTLMYLSRSIQVALATNMAGPLTLSTGPSGEGGWPADGNFMVNATPAAGTAGVLYLAWRNTSNSGTTNYTWYTSLLPTGTDNALIPPGDYNLLLAANTGGPAKNVLNFGIQLMLTSSDGTTATQLLYNNFQINASYANGSLVEYPIGSLGNPGNYISTSAKNRLAVRVFFINSAKPANGNVSWMVNNATSTSALKIPADITIPEIPQVIIFVILIAAAPMVPLLVSEMLERRRKKDKSKSWKDLWAEILGLSDTSLDQLPV